MQATRNFSLRRSYIVQHDVAFYFPQFVSERIRFHRNLFINLVTAETILYMPVFLTQKQCTIKYVSGINAGVNSKPEIMLEIDEKTEEIGKCG